MSAHSDYSLYWFCLEIKWRQVRITGKKNDQTDVDLTHKVKIKLFQSAINLIFVQIKLQKDFFPKHPGLVPVPAHSRWVELDGL